MRRNTRPASSSRRNQRFPGPEDGYDRQKMREDLQEYLKREADQDELQELVFPNNADPSKQGINPRRLDYSFEIDPASIIGFGNIGGMKT